MIAIHPLTHFDPTAFAAISGGYTTAEIYRVEWFESEGLTTFSLTLESLPRPKEFRFPLPVEDVERYTALVPNDYCFGAYDGDSLIGIALGELREWNRTVWVWEFRIAPAYHRQGIGRRLMAAVTEQAQASGQRALALETQNTNVPAIRFYRRVGYTLEGVDVSYYTNEDMLPGRTMAVFMKLRLE